MKWGTKLSYNTTNKSRSNKASKEAVRFTGAQFFWSGHREGRLHLRSEESTPLSSRPPWGRSPWTRPRPPPHPTPHTMAPRAPATGSSRRQRAPRTVGIPVLAQRRRVGSSAPHALPAPCGHQVQTRATPCPRVSAHPGSPCGQGGAPGLPSPQAPTARACPPRGRGPGGHLLSQWSQAAGAPTACRGPLHPSETPAGSPPGPRWFSWETLAPPR